MDLQAYVSIRGSRSPRPVHRDASPQDRQKHPDGTSTAFELSYGALMNIDGKLEGPVTVYLTRKHSAETERTVHAETVTI